MPRATSAGTYSGYVTEHKVDRGQNGGIQLVARCDMRKYMDRDTRAWVEIEPVQETAYLVLVTKEGRRNTPQVDSLKKALGWDGKSLRELTQKDLSKLEVSFAVRAAVDLDGAAKTGPDGSPFFNIAWINPVGGFRPVAPESMEAMETEWKALGTAEEESADKDITDQVPF